MKKFTSLALALAVSTSAMAVTVPQLEPVKVKDFSSIQLVEKVQATSRVDVNNNALVSKSLTTKAIPAGATVKPFYADPNGTFYPLNLYGGGSYGINLMLLPPYATLEWMNYTYYLDPTSGDPALAYQDYTWNWEYVDFNGSETATTASDLMTVNQPYSFKSYPEYPVTMTAQEKTELTYQSAMPIFGGNGELKPYFGQLAEIGETEYKGSYTFNQFSPDMAELFRTGYFGKDNNNTWATTWGSAYEDAGYTNFKAHAMCQSFAKPVAPYAISEMRITAFANAEAGAQLKFTFLKVNNEGYMTSEAIHEYIYTLPEAVNGSIEIPVEFTTSDEFGFEIGYKLIDCAMVMLVTGYTDDKWADFDLPFAAFIVGEPTETVLGPSCGAYCSFEKDGQTYVKICNGPYSYYTDDTRTTKMYPISYLIALDVEYPYLMTYGNYTTGESYEPASEFNTLIDATTSVTYGLLCYGKAEDISYDTADGSDIPEWLTIEIADNEVDYSSFKGEDVIVTFAVADGQDNTDKACDIVLSYKGKTQTYHIAHTSGVEGIKVDNSVAAKYYNLQGMEVANPENGLYIVKRGNNVTKEMIVK
ncbi:MAG: hypothetical protein II360_03185 [Muribaculaceae bacterium]|nr:hypothetical protein [Muribaculaceae bacterium]